MQILVLFIVGLVVVPILSAHEARKLSREINLGSWIIKPTFSNSKSFFKVNSKMFGFMIGIFAVVFVLLNMLN